MARKHRTKDKGVDAMSTANLLNERQMKYFNDMDTYIECLKKKPLESAKEEALEALKRTGVVTKRGNQKKKIVSWE